MILVINPGLMHVLTFLWIAIIEIEPDNMLKALSH